LNRDADIDAARAALARLSPTRADDRESWVKVGMALHAVDTRLLPEWVAFSQHSEKFKPGECEKLWKGFKPDKSNSLGVGSLIHWAREDSGNSSFQAGTVTPLPPVVRPTQAPAKPKATVFTTVEAAAEAVARQVGGTAADTWRYDTAAGTPALYIARVDLPGTAKSGKVEKTFRPIRPVVGGFELGDPAGLLPLYQQPALTAAKLVWVAEGEKAADAGASIGLCTTTSAHGAQSAARTDWTPLAGKHVRLFPDNDPEGAKYILKVGRILESLTPPANVLVVEIPGLPPHGDLHDWVEALRQRGLADGEIAGEVEELLRDHTVSLAEFRAEQTSGGSGGKPTPLSSDSQSPAATSGGSAGAAKATTGPIIDPRPVDSAGSGGSSSPPPPRFAEITPLPSDKPPVASFDYDFLPEKLGLWVKDIAERMQCAPDFVLVSVIVGLSSILGRKLGLRPKRYDDWLVVANLWGAVMGVPSVMKTPAVTEGTKPIRKLDAESKEAFEIAMAQHQAGALVRKIKRKESEKLLKKAIQDQQGDIEMLAAAASGTPSEAPRRRRRMVNDPTVEKLGEILAENPNGVLIFRDEINGFLRSMDKEGQESARGFYLQSWNGDSSYTYDRIGRGTVEIEYATVSILGTIQPGPFGEYLRAAAQGGRGDDGLVQRFQLLVYPDKPPTWENVDRIPDKAAREIAFEVFRWIDELTADEVGASTDPWDPDGIPYLHFDESAQQRFDEWRTRFEGRLNSCGEEEIFEAHLTKYRSLVPSLALICHLADQHVGPVGVRALDRAIATAEYLESHARRIYASVIRADVASARALAARITKGDVADKFVLRDVYQKGWARLGNANDVGMAVDLLVEHGWLASEEIKPKVGATKTIHHINTLVLPGAAAKKSAEVGVEGTGRTGTTPSEVQSAPAVAPANSAGGGPDGTSTTCITPPASAKRADGAANGTGKTGRAPVQCDLGFGAAEVEWL